MFIWSIEYPTGFKFSAVVWNTKVGARSEWFVARLSCEILAGVVLNADKDSAIVPIINLDGQWVYLPINKYQ